MPTSDMAYLLEDTTGEITDTDFCDVNDRRFLRVRKTLVRQDYIAVQVYDLGTVKPTSFSSDYHRLSRVVLTLKHSGSSLGTIKYDGWSSAVPVENYLRKPLLSRTRSRLFTMSDGQEYKWTGDTSAGHTWTCVNTQRYLVAHYDVRDNIDPRYPDSSGNSLTIGHTFIHLTVEIVASLTLLRHISQIA